MTAHPVPVDNTAFRALLSLPPVMPSACTAVAVPEMPAQVVVTGDNEVDAVLWLQEVVRTGDPLLIGKAMEAAKLIKTPMKVLEERYSAHLRQQPGAHAFSVVFASMDFGDLQKLAKRATDEAARRHDGLSRFGSMEAVHADTPAEMACAEALYGMRPLKNPFYSFNEAKAAKRFRAHSELAPGSLADCLHGLRFWHQLCRLRSAYDGCTGDATTTAQAHDDFCFASLARFMPRSRAEALEVLDYMEEHEHMGREETSAILRNLISGGTA